MIFNSLKNVISGSPRSSRIAGSAAEGPAVMAQLAQQCGFDLQVRGVDAHGTILSFGQVHMHPLMEDRFELKLLVVEAQRNILNDLLTIRPDRVFVEGLYEDQTSRDILEEKFSETRELILKSFSGYCAEHKLTRDQEGLLLNFMGPFIYLVLAAKESQHVSLLATTTKADSEWRDEAHLARPWDITLVVGDREAAAMRKVGESLKDEQGTVALIFGAGHQKNWPDACGSDFQPTIYSKDYSGDFTQALPMLESLDKVEQVKTAPLPLNVRIERAKTAFDWLNNSANWSNKKSPECCQMLEQLVDALAIFGLNIQGSDHELLLRYVHDDDVPVEARQRVIEALTTRLADCNPYERAAILNAFNSTFLLSQLMQDSRVKCAVLCHQILVRQPIDLHFANTIVSDALTLSEADGRKVLFELDLRRILSTNELERTSIDTALRQATDYTRLPL